MPPRRRKIVATETETVTVRRQRKRKIVATEENATEEFPAIRWAPGWGPADIRLTGAALRAQRDGQLQNTLRMLVAAAEADPVGDRHAVETMVTILRAGPSASVMERIYGRIT